MHNLKNLQDKSDQFNTDYLHNMFQRLVNASPNTKAATYELIDGFLYAVGNNHAGTYYSVIDTVLPLLLDFIKASDNEAFINTSYEILLDLYSFEADPESFSSESERLKCQDNVRSLILEFRNTYEPFQKLFDEI